MSSSYAGSPRPGVLLPLRGSSSCVRGDLTASDSARPPPNAQNRRKSGFPGNAGAWPWMAAAQSARAAYWRISSPRRLRPSSRLTGSSRITAAGASTTGSSGSAAAPATGLGGWSTPPPTATAAGRKNGGQRGLGPPPGSAGDARSVAPRSTLADPPNPNRGVGQPGEAAEYASPGTVSTVPPRASSSASWSPVSRARATGDPSCPPLPRTRSGPSPGSGRRPFRSPCRPKSAWRREAAPGNISWLEKQFGSSKNPLERDRRSVGSCLQTSWTHPPSPTEGSRASQRTRIRQVGRHEARIRTLRRQPCERT